MRRKRLTAQDAFVGVRESAPEAPQEAPETAEAPADDAGSPQDVAEFAAEAPGAPQPSPRRRPATSPEEPLQEALREAQEALAARTAIERLTLYLAPDVAGALRELWQEVRESSRIKVGKSVLAMEALRIVLSDPALRARAAAAALREKLGGRG